MSEIKGIDVPIEVGIIEDPEMIEVGIANQLGGLPMIVFLKDGTPSHALAFKGAAGEKLLQSFEALIHLFHGTGGEEESPSYVVPERKKKTHTLH